MAEGVKTGGRDWKPGESGNPKGRPEGSKNKDKGIVADLLREYLEESQEFEMGKGRQKRTILVKRKEMFVRALFQATMKGNVAAMRLLMNYTDGLPPLSVSVEGRLVNLNYDMELSAEDEEWYGELLSQFFMEPEALRKPKTGTGEKSARRRKGKD